MLTSGGVRSRRTGAFHIGRGHLQFVSLCFILMRNRVGGIYGRNLWRTFFLVSAASALMGAAVWVDQYVSAVRSGTSKLARLTDLAISIPLGLMVLYGSCRILGVTELDMALNGVAGPLQRRLHFLRARISKQ